MDEWFFFVTLIVVTFFFLKLVTLPPSFFKTHFKSIVILGFVLRILCFLIPPIWEDDWARYLWEGHLIRQSISPYEIPPIEFFGDSSLDQFTNAILSQVNHPEWTTIYSPFVLVYFSLFTYGFSTFLLKLSYFVFESISFLSVTDKHHAKPILLYWTCPILIKEVYVNLHFEILIVSFFWLYIQFLKQKQWKRSAFTLGMMVHTKFFAILYGAVIIPYFLLLKRRQIFLSLLSFFGSAIAGFSLFYILYLLIFPETKDFGFSNLHRFGDTFTFNQFFEPVWSFFHTINLRSFPFLFSFILLFIYVYLLLPSKNRGKRFLVLCKQYQFLFYFGYFLLTILPVYNPWYFLTLIPLISMFPSKNITPWVLIFSLQLSYLTNVRLLLPFQHFYEISTPILLLEASISITCILQYFKQLFILLYNLSNISNIASKG